MFAFSVRGGFVITAENDVFMDSDDNYSHGSEIEYTEDATGQIEDGDPFRVGYGINQLMFTPNDISDPNMPTQSDRPWCGTFSMYYETWTRTKSEEIRTRYSIGTIGPDSHSEESQKTVHEWLGCDTPMGWDNQMPNELMFNIYQDRYYTLYSISYNRFGTDIDAVYGGTLGTAYVNGRIGTQIRIGYNIPPKSVAGRIVPKAIMCDVFEYIKNRGFVYLLCDASESLVLHNATIGSSIFRDREEGQERDLEPFVFSYDYGIVAGLDKLSVTFLIEHETSEFKGEEDDSLSYGMLRIEYTSHF